MTKTPKTFRLSEEAIAILDKQSNATDYIEQAILKVEPSLIEQKIDYLIELVTDIGSSSNGRTSGFGSDNLGSTPSEPAMTLADAKKQVADLEAKRDEELEFVQDPGTTKGIGTKYQSLIDDVWAEYNEGKSSK